MRGGTTTLPKVTSSQKKRIRALGRFDLAATTARVAGKKGRAAAHDLEREFRRVATLWILEPRVRLSPSRPVDEYWHELILDTKKYARFCRTVFGRFIHHVVMGDASDASLAREYARTIKAYTRHFGPPPVKYWPSAKGPHGIQRAFCWIDIRPG